MIVSYTILYLLNHIMVSVGRALNMQQMTFFMSGYYAPLINCLRKRYLTHLTFTYAAILLAAEALMIWVL